MKELKPEISSLDTLEIIVHRVCSHGCKLMQILHEYICKSIQSMNASYFS